MHLSPTKFMSDPLLARALEVFLQYGYRKTSLEQIANAAGFSRQTLYQRYKSKQNLFKSAVSEYLDSSLRASGKVLAGQEFPFEERLAKAFEFWGGYYAEMLQKSPHINEILSAGNMITGELIESRENEFIRLIVKALEKNRGTAPSPSAGLGPEQVARVLYFACKGMVEASEGLEHFVEEAKLAIRVICGNEQEAGGD